MFVWWLVKRAWSLKRKCGDPRSSEQIIRDYRDGDGDGYPEPQPRDYDTILDYFDARLKWHDRDDRDGDSDDAT